MNLSEIRTALWHLRKGGIRQMSHYLSLQEQQRQRNSTKAEDIARREQQERAELRGFDPLYFPQLFPNPHRDRPFEQFTVGAILDEFSVLAWGQEFTLELLLPETWKDQVDAGIDFLLVESAWQGNGGKWSYQVVGTQAPSQSLQDLVLYCQQRGMPTVMWNKGDPVHFYDFIDSAQLFDIVATTDVD